MRSFTILTLMTLVFPLGCEKAADTAVADTAQKGDSLVVHGNAQPAQPGDTTPPPPASPAKEWQFLMVEGGVKIDGKPAAVGTTIGKTSSISVGPKGHAVIALDSGSVIDVRPGTQVKLGSSPRKNVSVKLLLGALWSFIPTGSSYEIDAPNAVAGVRGTSFFVEAHKNKSSYICACNGSVDIETKDGKTFKQTVESPNADHKSFNFVNKGKIQTFKTADRQNHTKEQKDELAKIQPLPK